MLEIAPGSVQGFDLDIRDEPGLRQLLAAHEIDGVVHLAGLKAVGESVEHPSRYYDNNVRGTRVLLSALKDSRVRKFVFSSSATVYAPSERMPLDESAPTAPQCPYGENKLEIEDMLAAMARADSSWRVANLRYFNPVGAHPSGSIGEDPTARPTT